LKQAVDRVRFPHISSGVKAVDKREGGGSHNWGTYEDEMKAEEDKANVSAEGKQMFLVNIKNRSLSQRPSLDRVQRRDCQGCVQRRPGVGREGGEGQQPSRRGAENVDFGRVEGSAGEGKKEVFENG